MTITVMTLRHSATQFIFRRTGYQLKCGGWYPTSAGPQPLAI